MKPLNLTKRSLSLISAAFLGIYYFISLLFFLDRDHNFRYYYIIEAEYGIGNLAVTIIVPIVIIMLVLGRKTILTPILIGALGALKIVSAFVIVPTDEVFRYFTHMPIYYDLFFGSIAIGLSCIIAMIIMFGKIAPQVKGHNPSIIIGIIGAVYIIGFFIVTATFYRTTYDFGGYYDKFLVNICIHLGLMFAGFSYSNKTKEAPVGVLTETPVEAPVATPIVEAPVVTPIVETPVEAPVAETISQEQKTYTEAILIINSATTEREYRKAQHMFYSLGNFRDSDAKRQYCADMAAKINS